MHSKWDDLTISPLEGRKSLILVSCAKRKRNWNHLWDWIYQSYTRRGQNQSEKPNNFPTTGVKEPNSTLRPGQQNLDPFIVRLDLSRMWGLVKDVKWLLNPALILFTSKSSFDRIADQYLIGRESCGAHPTLS